MMRFLMLPLFMALLLAVILIASARGQDLTLPNVTVSGEASTSVQPDLAEIRAGVTNQARTAREAADANAKTMTAVLAAAKEAGIEAKDIQTARISVQPLFSRPQPEARNEPPRITGYQVTNNVTLRLRDISRIGEMLDRLIAAGANNVHGIDFQVSESSKLMDTVRAAAVSDARRKAEIYAQAAGVQLGRVVAIAETDISMPRANVMRASVPAQTPIAGGEEMLRVLLRVSFELVR